MPKHNLHTCPFKSLLSLVYRAGEELGYKVGDFNGDLQDGGFTVADTTTVSGRENTFSVFLTKKLKETQQGVILFVMDGPCRLP